MKRPDARDVAEDANLKAMFGERVGPPLSREPVVVQLAFWRGKAYIAPLGSAWDVPEPWKRVASLDDAADRVGVEWTVQS